MLYEIEKFIDKSTIDKIKYNTLVYNLTEKFGNFFRSENNLINTELYDNNLINKLYFYTPLIFHSNNKNAVDIKNKLYFHIGCKICNELIEIKNNIKTKDDRLICVGNGCINNNCIMLIGMSAGFFNANLFDKISFPFKFSFYFGETSEMLRIGFKNKLNNIYFTNLAKCAYNRKIMNKKDVYNNIYSICIETLKNEMLILKPKIILAFGTNVFKFLMKNNISCKKIIHPAYFLFRKNKKNGIEYYKKICEEL